MSDKFPLTQIKIGWQSDILIKQGQCSESGNVTWSTGDNICNGTSYQSCMPAWDGIVQYKVKIKIDFGKRK